ncbi:pilin [Patescibacteria group bacterium]|nr:pilin [Patescibacteria group bacterium]
MIVYAQQLQTWDTCMIDVGGTQIPTLKCLEVVYGNILVMASAFIVLVLFIMFVVGGFRYLTSFGNAEKVKKAQGTLRYALIGFILFISAFLILKVIDVIFLGGCGRIFQFSLDASTAATACPP